MHMLCHTALPTAADSFAIAANGLLLSFSPLKMRECTGSGCVRQSISHMGGRGGWGADGSSTECMGTCSGISELVAKQPPFLKLPSHHCTVEIFGFVEGFYWCRLQRQNFF